MGGLSEADDILHARAKSASETPPTTKYQGFLQSRTKTFSIGDRFEKDNVRIRVVSIQEDAAVVELQYAPRRPPRPPANPCQWMRTAIIAQRGVTTTLYQQLEAATSEAERAELQQQLETEYAQLTALEQDYAAFCPGPIP